MTKTDKPEPEPVTVADQKAGGTAPEDTVTVASQRSGDLTGDERAELGRLRAGAAGQPGAEEKAEEQQALDTAARATDLARRGHDLDRIPPDGEELRHGAA